MKIVKRLLLLTMLLMFASVANIYASKSIELGFRMKVIAEYEYDLSQYNVDAKTAKQYLSGLSIIDASGHLVQYWSLSNGSDGVSYSRTELTYDNRGNVTSESVYASSKGEPGEYFSVVYTSKQAELIPSLDDKLAYTTFKRYDRLGHIKERRTVDGNGKLIESQTYQYDGGGHQISSHQVYGNGTADCDSNTTYSQGFLVSTEISHNCDQGREVKTIAHNDRSGRELLDEGYSVSKKDGTSVLVNRAAYSYSGDVTNLEWSFWNNSGEPTSKLLIVDKGDYEVSRRTFEPAAPSGNSKDRTQWKETSLETRQYIFDASGVITKETWQRRESPDGPFKISWAVERIVTYY